MAADLELPLELPTLCRQLGIGLRIDQSNDRRRGALMRSGRSWEVVLMRTHNRPAPISPHERFTIAHELGHYVLMRDTAFRARREAEYWLGEDLCNRFASRLLIPERALMGLGEPDSSRDLATSVYTVAKRAGVTFEPAARALVERTSAPVAIGTFRLDPFPPTRRLGWRGWWVENRAWWGARGGRRLAIYVDHALAPVLVRMRAMKAGETVSPPLAGACSTRLRRSPGTIASFTALLASA